MGGKRGTVNMFNVLQIRVQNSTPTGYVLTRFLKFYFLIKKSVNNALFSFRIVFNIKKMGILY